MDINELVKTYGSQTKLAKALGVTRAAVNQWVLAGRMPKGRMWQVMAGAVKPPERPLQPITGEDKGKV
jgi:DNA-binding transcriptional regulator YdaS (Cro superfamily)